MTPLVDSSLRPYSRVRAIDATGRWDGKELCALVDRNLKPAWATWDHSSKAAENELIDAMVAVANAGGSIFMAEPWEWPSTLGPVVAFQHQQTKSIRIFQIEPPTVLMEIVDQTERSERLARAAIALWNEGSAMQ